MQIATLETKCLGDGALISNSQEKVRQAKLAHFGILGGPAVNCLFLRSQSILRRVPECVPLVRELWMPFLGILVLWCSSLLSNSTQYLLSFFYFVLRSFCRGCREKKEENFGGDRDLKNEYVLCKREEETTGASKQRAQRLCPRWRCFAILPSFCLSV